MQPSPLVPAPIALAVVLALGVVSVPLHAADAALATQSRSISIPAQPLAQALNDWARQVGAQIVVPQALVAGKQAPAVSGTLTPRQALDKLLAGSGLTASIEGDNAIIGKSPAPATATQGGDAMLEAIQVSGDWLGSGLENSAKTFAGARTVVKRNEIEATGAASIGDVMRRIPGVQSTDNAGSAGTALSLNIGVRGMTGRYTPRSTVLLDGIPLAFAPYGQPQLSFAPISLDNIEAIDVVRGGGAVRYGPQNVGGIINFKTRAIPTGPGLTSDATVRQTMFGEGGSTIQYSAFLGSQLDNGLGLALLYSGSDGSSWRKDTDQKVNDVAFKFRYELSPNSEVYGKLSYYDVRADTPGGLTVAQYEADAFQNTRPHNHWNGERKGIDLGYLNALSDTAEFEVRMYYNESLRESVLASGTGSTPASLAHSPRDYEVLGIEPRYTQRFGIGRTINDITVGYRYIHEQSTEKSFNEAFSSGVISGLETDVNETDAHALYVDDKIAWEAWRITPGVRFERIKSVRNHSLEVKNHETLPALNVAYLLNPAVTLFANYGTSFGPVQNSQVNFNTPANPLIPELARTIEVGGRWHGSNLNAEVTAFTIHFDNQIQSVGSGADTIFFNLGATKHEGVESAIAYTFDEAGMFAGLNVFANLTQLRATQESGVNAGKDVPFYSRTTDTIGARYLTGRWGVNLSSTHQTRQFSNEANTVAETSNGRTGEIPGYRVWNAQFSLKVPGVKGFDLVAGVNNLTDKRYYTRITASGDGGRLVGAPRTVYVQGRLVF